jgi:hypothetical protein
MANITPEKQLSDLLITRNFEPQALDVQGKPATDPDQAKMFSFDYSGESGKDYGTVVAMLDEDNNMSIYFGDNVGKNMESDDKKSWFDFLYQLRQYAKRNLMSFSLQNLNKLKYSMQGQAAIKEGLFESWAGKKDLSWNAPTTEARLMIKHKRAIGEGEARFRYVESLFIETADGERFKMPFKSLTAGKAMLEHVRQGGRPYDIRGQHITTIVEEMNLLARFRRANQGRIFEGETQQLVEQATEYLGNLQQTLKSLTSRTGYKKYFESWNPAELRDEDVIIEDLRHMFVEQNIDSRVEQALPVLARLKQETAMKEMNVFEGWINLLSEGTWTLPDTAGKQQQLITLLSQELPVGPDAINAQEQLYDLLGDDELFDRLEELAEQNPDADARTIILNRLEQMKSNPAVAQVIGKLKIEINPADQPEGEQPVQEGFNSYNIDSTPCPKCHKKELTYLQGSNHVKCGGCGCGFTLAGKPINEFAPGNGHGDEDHLFKLARQWAHAENNDDDDAITNAEHALANLGYGISEIEDGSGQVQLVPTGEYMIDWNDDDIIVFHAEELAESGQQGREIDPPELDSDVEESCHTCHKAKPMCECSIYEEKDTVEKDAKGKVKSWKHEGDWEKVKKRNGKEVDPRGEVTHMSDKAQRETEKLKESAGDVMFKDQERLDRLESLRSFAKAVGNTSKAEELDQQIKAIYAANPVGSQDKGHLEELSPDTLKSYVKKASSDRAIRNFDQGVDTGTTFNDRTPKFDVKNSRKDDQRRSGIHKALDRLEESGMSEADLLFQEIARGNVDIYDIYANPKTNVEKFVSDQIHDRVEELGHERPDLHHDDDIEKILQIIFDDLGDEYGVDEGAIGQAVGTVAGMALAPEIPGSGMIGGYIGDKLGDKISGDEVDESDTVYDPITKTMVPARRARVKMGGGWRKTDPETGRVKDSSDPSEIGKHKDDLGEGTALQGQYGHSGHMEAVKPQDADMMDRIKFLAGVTK